MKRMVLCLIILVTGITLLSSCGVDFFSGKRPIDYDNTKWVSSEPDIWFTVQDRISIGEITIDGVTTEIWVIFDFGNGVSFRPPRTSENQLGYYNYGLFEGTCEFSKDRLIVTIADNKKNFLSDTIKEIIFVREDM